MAVTLPATLPESVTFRVARLSRSSELATGLNGDSLRFRLGFTFSECPDITRAVEEKVEGGNLLNTACRRLCQMQKFNAETLPVLVTLIWTAILAARVCHTICL